MRAVRVYLAGPDIFRPDALAWAESARALCAQRGHEAIIPLDADATTAEAIFRANIRMLHSADAVLANLNPFWGAEPDSGTCVEVGYALALGKPVVGYIEAAVPMSERIGVIDGEGYRVEGFGLPLNLMLAVPCRLVAGGLAGALAAL